MARAYLIAALLAAGCGTRPSASSAPDPDPIPAGKAADHSPATAVEWSGAGLDQDAELRARVLGQTFGQVVQRYGPVRYQGSMGLRLNRNGHAIDHQERGRIEVAPGGDLRVRQWGDDNRLLREAIRVNGTWHVRNGEGALRRADYVQNERLHPEDEVFSPLSAFAEKLGPALRLRPDGSDGIRVRYRAVPGADPAPVGEVDRVEGSLVVDRSTGVPLEAHLRAELSVAGEKEPGKLVLTVDFEVRSAEASPFDVSKAVDPIMDRSKTHDPIAFLKGETRTSTVIGGD